MTPAQIANLIARHEADRLTLTATEVMDLFKNHMPGFDFGEPAIGSLLRALNLEPLYSAADVEDVLLAAYGHPTRQEKWS